MRLNTCTLSLCYLRLPINPLNKLVWTNLEGSKGHPQCLNQDRVMPVLSNQKMNAFLKEIADLCGIDLKPKHLCLI
ncbi:hypothetical protein [Pontibacter sp. HSC-14F20]|uniref:hypothetical protein n=1 Tax=Pontibacter sp. HSC-14F20 TaxID=2864136 RepID=UPI0021022B16|nr:hypothetical protein [Pontibacter sp. HSC-14F20]